ncbi:MAG TPA: glycosyltransferase family 4 protein [Candidatus Dormibacteraeota bacterium]
MLTPDALEVVMVSLEGPDQYSQAGGLGVRARELCRALAAAGYRTTLVFAGDPAKPGEELDEGVHLVRWAQHVSARHPSGVYAGEEEKIADLEASLPAHLVRGVVAPAAARGAAVAVLCEEWQTAGLCVDLSRRLELAGLRDRCVLVWNANNHFGFDRIEWRRLEAAAAITTVSRYMKHLMWSVGVNATVIPNGVPESAFAAIDRAAVTTLRRAAGPCLAVKIGRFSADKRWLQAIDAISRLRAQGTPARMLIRGGIEPYGGEVLTRAAALDLDVLSWDRPVRSAADLATALRAGAQPLINLRTFLPDAVIPVMYAAATGVLANSGHEPFGLVGLEAMAAGAVAFVGATGEDYARPYVNSIVIESDDPAEVAGSLQALVDRPALGAGIRKRARRDAAEFAWPLVVDGLMERLDYVAAHQGVGSQR